MAFDACMMRAILTDIRTRFSDAKIEKVLSPVSDEIDLVLHAQGNSMRLVMNVGPNAPRIGLSRLAKENPKTPSMLCMLLRKRLAGARIREITQQDFDRIARISLSAYDEMGFSVSLSIVVEIMGKYANFILLDENEKIITAMKLVDFSASTVRQVLPGLTYTVPEDRGRRSPLVVDRAFFDASLDAFPDGRTVERFITTTYSGIATQVAHELSFLATGAIDTPLSATDRETLYRVFSEWQQLLIEERYTPVALVDASGKPTDYCYMPLTYFGQSREMRVFADFAALFDFYFAERDRLERIHQRGGDLLRLVHNARARTERKLEIQRAALMESENAEQYRRAGDLITANLYKLKKGMTEIEVTDYYDEACPTVTLSLDARLTPAQNAQRSYKLYSKAKTAKAVLTERIAEWEGDLYYLSSVEDFLLRATTEQDLVDLRDELYRSGYASKMKGHRPQKNVRAHPLEATTSGGYRVLIGRNNQENDLLTFKIASKGDLWFHVKDLPGSHVILLCDGEEPSERDYTEAAALAAYHSKATADLVAVDYTRVKNIKKPPGAKLGFVTYKTNYTAFVRPSATVGGEAHGSADRSS